MRRVNLAPAISFSPAPHRRLTGGGPVGKRHARLAAEPAGTPSPPAPPPLARADRGRDPRESGIRVSRPGPPGPPSPPSPLSRGGGRGGEAELGEGQALPQTPGLPRRGRIPTDTSPCQAAAGEGEHRSRGRTWPSPGAPGCRGAAASQSLSNGHFPCQLARGEGEKLIRGRAWPSPGPSACRGAAASRWRPSPVRSQGERGLGGEEVPPTPPGTSSHRIRTGIFPCGGSGRRGGGCGRASRPAEDCRDPKSTVGPTLRLGRPGPPAMPPRPASAAGAWSAPG